MPSPSHIEEGANMATTSGRQFAVVTGASSGIGFELAKQFVQNNFDVLICAENPEINTAAQELRSLGADVQALQVDLTSRDGVQQLEQAIDSSGRMLDVAALNAGVGVSGPFAETDFSAEMNMVELNVVSTLRLAKYVVQKMVGQGSGRILFTSSIAATMPTPYEAVYGATKAFVRNLSQSIREELKETGITVTALMPGATETPFFEKAGALDTKLGASEKDDPAEVAKDGFEALMAGKDHVVAGAFKNKLQAAAGFALPDPMVAKAHAGMSAPGSAHKK